MEVKIFFNGEHEPFVISLNKKNRKILDRCLSSNERWLMLENGTRINLFNVDFITDKEN